MGTILEKLADWVSSLRFEDVPGRVVEKAKLQLLSIMAAVYSGYPVRTVRTLREIALSTRANGRSRVFPQGDRTSPTVAVMANAAASMALDYDDYLFMGHTSHSAVLGALAFAEEVGASGRQLLCALVAANELGGRLGASVMLGPQNGQLWTHLHALCAAAAAARLAELKAQPTAHALALALYQPPLAQWPGFLGPDSKLLSAAFPARDGLLAARAAAWGLSGPLDILENPRGFGANFSSHFLPEMFTGLGQAWVTDTLSFKTVPGCAYLSSAVEALGKIAERFRAENGRSLEQSDVVRGMVYTSLLGWEMDRLISEAGAASPRATWINFSIPYSLGLVLIAGKLTPLELSEDFLTTKWEQLQAAAARFRVCHDWAFTMDLFAAWSKHLPLVSWFRKADWRRLLSALPGGGKAWRGLLQSRGGVKAAGTLVKGWRNWRHADSPKGSFDLGQANLEKLSMPFASRVELYLRRRKVMTETVVTPAGAAGRDAAESVGLVRRKFREAALPFLGPVKTERAMNVVARLEELETLEPLDENFCLN